MKLTTISGLAAAVALFLPLGATAQSLSEIEELSHEDRRAWFEAMSPDEREAKRAELMAERDAMSDEDRRAMRDRRRAKWDSLSDEERDARREQMRGRHDEMRRRFESMSPEEREAFKQQRRERDHGNHDRHRGDHAGKSRSEKDSM